MKIHEYQAKQIIQTFDIPIQDGILCFSEQEVVEAANHIGYPVVIKAQVLVGGRGKAGGIKLVNSAEKARAEAGRIIGMDIKGIKVEKVLVVRAIDIEKEFYLGMIYDRNSKSVLIMASTEGGVEIEEVAKTNPEKILKFSVDAGQGVQPYLARKIGYLLFNQQDLVEQFIPFLSNLYRSFIHIDASLLEINPLVLSKQGKLIALDAKINIDDNALFRHEELEAMRESDEEELKEENAKAKGLTYIKLSGNIGCMVNGAGLAMATMDMIQLYGGQPANFLDIGGSSNPQKVIDAMEIILSDKQVKVILINIFGGITRCDDVAKGLVQAFSVLKTNIPVVIRLTGTNDREGHEILKGQNFILVTSMSEAAKKAISLI